MKHHVDETACRWNIMLTKHHLEQTSHWPNILSTKQHVGQTSRWPNNMLTRHHVDLMSDGQMTRPKAWKTNTVLSKCLEAKLILTQSQAPMSSVEMFSMPKLKGNKWLFNTLSAKCLLGKMFLDQMTWHLLAVLKCLGCQRQTHS